jgi:hypothetical protein
MPTDVFPVKYENHLYEKAIIGTDRGNLYGWEIRRVLHCPDNRLTIEVMYATSGTGRALLPIILPYGLYFRVVL